MNKYSFFFLLFFLTACKKQEISPNNPIFGEWQWKYSQGGIAGLTITPTSAGYNKKILLDFKYKFALFKNGVLEESGQFEVVKATSIFQKEPIDFIKLSNGKSYVISQISEKELILSDNFPDGFSYYFSKN